MSKKYVVQLTPEERKTLEGVVAAGRLALWKVHRAQSLLKCDAGPLGPAWADAQVVEAFGVSTRSVESWRKRAVEEGPLSLLERVPEGSSRGRPLKLDGEKEARLTQLACSPAPSGHTQWTLRLLGQRLVELDVVDSISHETVRRTLKKTS